MNETSLSPDVVFRRPSNDTTRIHAATGLRPEFPVCVHCGWSVKRDLGYAEVSCPRCDVVLFPNLIDEIVLDVFDDGDPGPRNAKARPVRRWISL